MKMTAIAKMKFFFLVLGIFIFLPQAGQAGITDQWYPVPAANNRFLKDHYKYAQLLWAFDYGHALIYEQMWRNAQSGDFDFSLVDGPAAEPAKAIFTQVMEILANPPKQQPAEEALSPNFTMEFSWLMDLFSWTHKLHWVVYDVLATEPLDRAKIILRQQLEEAYRRYPLLALTTKCKSMMAFMEQQPYSMRFRRNAPNSNGLIWAYHYYQLALYEGLLLPPGVKREAKLKEVYNKFQRMAEDPASNVPQMPMARTVAPAFFREFPELSAIFDNLHELHDVVGDLLAISEPLKLDPKDATVRVAVPDSIKIKIPGDPKGYVMVNYDLPAVKRKQMDWMVGIALDEKNFLIDCKKNGHDD